MPAPVDPDRLPVATRPVVEIDGQPLEPALLPLLDDLLVTLDHRRRGRFSFALAGPLTAPDGTASMGHLDDPALRPGRPVRIGFESADGVVILLSGTVTSLTARFPGDGPPSLVVAGDETQRAARDRRGRGDGPDTVLALGDALQSFEATVTARGGGRQTAIDAWGASAAWAVLWPGGHVVVEGVGDTYGGRYRVDEVTHGFGTSGYRQRFALRRNPSV